MGILNGVIAPEIKVEFDLSSPGGPKEPGDSTWTTVSNDVIRSISIRRGKTQENQTVQAGECTIVFDNRSGDFDPMNSSSPYWTDLIPAFGGFSYLSTHMGVRVWARWSGTDYVLYTGYLEQLSMDYGLNPTATITFTDSIAWLAQQFPNAVTTPVGNGDPVYLRFGRVLDAVNFPTLLRGLDISVSNTMYGTKLDSDATTLLQQAADCGPARYFVDAVGLVRCEPWDGGVDRGLILSDDPTDTTAVGYDLIEVDPGSRYLVNAVGVTKVDGNGDYRGYVFAADGISELKYGVSMRDYTLPTNTATPVANFLAYQYSTPIDRVRRITFSHTKLGSNFPKTLQTDLADYVSINRTTYDGRSLAFTCQVEGVEHDITPESWSMGYITSTLGVEPAGGDYWFGAIGFDGYYPGWVDVVATDSLNNVYGASTTGAIYYGEAVFIAKVNSNGVLQRQQFMLIDGASTIAGFHCSGTDVIVTFNNSGTNPGVYVVKLDADGGITWSTRIDTASSVLGSTVDSSGNVFLGLRNGDFVKVTSAGAIAWQRSITTYNYIYDVKYFASDSVGDFYAAGLLRDGRYTDDYIGLIKFSSSGSVLWQKRINEGTVGLDLGSVICDSADSVYVAVSALNGCYLHKFDSSGSLVWQKSTATSSGFDTRLRAVDSADNLYGIGSRKLFSKISSSGSLIYRRDLDCMNDLTVNSAGDVCTVGYTNSFSLQGVFGKIPNDGSKTGYYTITGPSTVGLVYAGATADALETTTSAVTAGSLTITSTTATTLPSALSTTSSSFSYAATYI